MNLDCLERVVLPFVEDREHIDARVQNVDEVGIVSA
jgi:hypothetical protein